MTCLLCSRQFKTVEMLKRHSNESGLHKVIARDDNAGILLTFHSLDEPE